MPYRLALADTERELDQLRTRYAALRYAVLTDATSPSYWHRRIAQIEANQSPPQAGAAPSCSCRAIGPGSVRVAPVDLEQVDAELDEVRANVGHGEAAYQPWALQALRAAELLRAEVDRVEALRAELAAELEDLQVELAETEGPLRARAGWSGVLAAHLRFLAQAVEQAQQAQVGQPFREAWHAVLVAVEQARAALDALDSEQPPVRIGGIVTRPRRPLVGETGPEVRRIRCMPPGHTCPGPFGYCGACPDRPAELRTLDEVQAQTLYAGLPNLPTEPAVADDEQLQHWNEHQDHTDAEGADRG